MNPHQIQVVFLEFDPEKDQTCKKILTKRWVAPSKNYALSSFQKFVPEPFLVGEVPLDVLYSRW